MNWISRERTFCTAGTFCPMILTARPPRRKGAYSVKRLMEGNRPCLNEHGLEVGRLVVRQKDKNELWALHPAYMGIIIRELTADVPGPNGQPGTGFGPHAFRNVCGSDYLRRHPGDYEGLADYLYDDFMTVFKNYVWLNKERMAAKRREDRARLLLEYEQDDNKARPEAGRRNSTPGRSGNAAKPRRPRGRR